MGTNPEGGAAFCQWREPSSTSRTFLANSLTLNGF